MPARLATLLSLAALAACNGGGGAKVEDSAGSATATATGTGTGTGGTGTGTGGMTGNGTADCVLASNPYVVDCTADLDTAAPVTLVLSAAGLPTRTFVSSASQTQHQLWGWGLRANTVYDWTMGPSSGQVTTGPTPAGLASADIEVTGTLFGMDAALVYINCGYFVLIDSDGEIIGGMPTSTYDNFVDGMMWSQADRSILAVKDSDMSPGSSSYSEHHISGTELQTLSTSDFSLRLTHDVGRWGPYTYLLGGTGQIHGFEVFEGTTNLGRWLITDDFNVNNSHVNGIALTETGEVILSDLTSNTIIAVDGDPNSATFLDVNWHAAGISNAGLANADYRPSTGTIFRGQHNASRHGDELWVFDNGSTGTARALRMAMDHTNGTLTELDSWSTGQVCPNQGGAIPIPGGVLATCANASDVYAFRDGSETPDWTLHADCGGGNFLGQSTRAFPVTVE